MSSKYNDEIEDIFKNNTQDILKIAGFENAKITRFINLEKEIKLDFSIETDFAVEIEINGERSIVHFEAQTYYQNNIPKRLFDYNMSVYLQTGLKVHSILFLLSKKGYKEENIKNSYTHKTHDILR